MSILSVRNLDALAVKHGTDKASTQNNLTPAYQRELADMEIRALLEIGIHEGASLRMWREWLPDATIVGIDKKPEAVASIRSDENIITVLADQSDEAALKNVCEAYGPFDVIIDDGSHLPEHVAESLTVLWDYMHPGGVYVIEDLQCAYSPEYPHWPYTVTDLLRYLGERTHWGYPRLPRPVDFPDHWEGEWEDLCTEISCVTRYRDLAFLWKAI